MREINISNSDLKYQFNFEIKFRVIKKQANVAVSYEHQMRRIYVRSGGEHFVVKASFSRE